jgi:hypothetical protein
MKSGYVAAKKKIGDRWTVRFDRKAPKDGQSKSWYVKLQPDAPEPFVSETQIMKFDEDLLKELEPLGGCDYYEYTYSQTFKSNQTYTPTTPNGESEKPDSDNVNVPSTLGFEVDPNNIALMAAGAANILAFSPISNQVENMDEMGELIEGMTLRMFSIVNNVHKKLGK